MSADIEVVQAATGEVVQAFGQLLARTVDLTSRLSRQAANRLYERLGLRPRDSRVHRLAGGQ